MRQGEIKEGRGGLYTVREEDGTEHVLRAKKKFRREGLVPLPGDQVLFSPREGEEHGWLEEVLPRTSLCLRPPVANIQRMLIVVAQEPLPDWLLVDKLLLHARIQGITPLLAVNKCDMGTAAYEEARRSYAGAELPVFAVSAHTGQGLDDLRQALQGHLGCLAGQSGVGKSALLSRLMAADLTSGAISERSRRGRQTTRHTTLLYHEGLKLLDTPGFSLLDMPEDLEPQDIGSYYPEFMALPGSCRFQPCHHVHEPGCRVKEALKQGGIDADRHARYADLVQAAQTAWKERYD